MKKNLFGILVVTLTSNLMFAACKSDDNPGKQDNEGNLAILQEWRAGNTVTSAAVEAFGGVDNCFAAEPIPDNVWERMQGKTYKENPNIGRDDLRHIRALHWDYDNQIHVGEMICSKLIASRVANILRQLYDAHYPIQLMVLPDVYNADDEQQMRANNSSCFCYRAIAGTTKLSKHARGLAVDINTLYNPYYKDRDDGTPVTVCSLSGTVLQNTTVRQGCISLNGIRQGVYAVQLGKLGSTLIRR